MSNWRQLRRTNNGVRSNQALARILKKESYEEAPQQIPLVGGGKPKLPRKKQLECARCSRRYSADEVYSGTYRLETMICSNCYAEMQQMPRQLCCFGKPGYVVTPYNRKRLYGYNAHAIECRELCPDRVVCRLVVCGPNKIEG